MNSYLLICVLIIFVAALQNPRIENFFNEEACSIKITDVQYLQHMIPHHQVAIDMSIILQRNTKNPTMQNIIRKLIWVQKYEIELMKYFIKRMPVSVNNSIVLNRNYISTVSDFIKPNSLNISKTYCDPLFFDPKKHMKHMKHMKIDDEMYIKHMIPHHQVAVDMSKKLLKNTKNTFMINLAYRIIRNQQEEIIILNDLLHKNNINYKSNNLN
tara:strand:+ start:10593 stop:11231 length:639 start_codon:yes stop_codon:yes gene_type:complete